MQPRTEFHHEQRPHHRIDHRGEHRGEQMKDLKEVLSAYVNKSPTYNKLRNQGTPVNEAISRTCLEVADDSTNELSDDRRSLLRVTAHLGTFIDAQHRKRTIEDNDGRPLSRQEKSEIIALKNEHLIPFNHLLKEYINTHSNDSFDDTASLFAKSYIGIYRPDALARHQQASSETEALGFFQSTLNGMRHELAAETLLAAGGYDYDFRTSVADDANGTDLFVLVDDTYQPIDVKASNVAAQRALERHPFSRPVWTGLSPSDFNGQDGSHRNALSISFSRATEKCDDFMNGIRDTIAMSDARRATTGMRLGRVARTPF